MQLAGPSVQYDGDLVLCGQSDDRAGAKVAPGRDPLQIVRGDASQRTGRNGIFPYSAESSDRTRGSGCDLRGTQSGRQELRRRHLRALIHAGVGSFDIVSAVLPKLSL